MKKYILNSMTTQVNFFIPNEIVENETLLDYSKSVCWWDLHPFKRKNNENISCVTTYDKNTFYTIGTFCSLNCAKAYCSDRKYNIGYFNLYCKIFFKRNLLPILKQAPKRECLTIFGGPITIQKFRENATRPTLFIKCITYTDTFITPSILETECIEYKPSKVLEINFLEDENDLEMEAIEFEKNRNKKKKRGRVGSKTVVLYKKNKKIKK
jgi:hypothetical protein